MVDILLRGQTVDVIVELTKLQSRMNAIKSKLKKLINNFSNTNDEIEDYLSLEDDLKFVNIYLKFLIVFFSVLYLLKFVI